MDQAEPAAPELLRSRTCRDRVMGVVELGIKIVQGFDRRPEI